MNSLRSSLVEAGFDPNYEAIAVEALKRGRNGDGRQFEVDVTKRAGMHLGLVCLRTGELGVIGQTVDMAVDYEVGVEALGQLIADILVDKLATNRTLGNDDNPSVYARI